MDLLAKDADQATKDAEEANSSANESPKRSIPLSKFQECSLLTTSTFICPLKPYRLPWDPDVQLLPLSSESFLHHCLQLLSESRMEISIIPFPINEVK